MTAQCRWCHGTGSYPAPGNRCSACAGTGREPRSTAGPVRITEGVYEIELVPRLVVEG